MKVMLMLMLAVPACAQFRTIEVTFEGIGCESCIGSLPDRLQRIRGVESATVDAAKGLLRLKLAEQNRVRVEQVRDAIQQDGTKAVSAVVTIQGEVVEEQGRWILHPGGSPATYIIDGKVQAGPQLVKGKIADLRAASPLTIATSQKD